MHPYTFQDSRKAFNKFTLLWGEAQLCLPYVCLSEGNVDEMNALYQNETKVKVSA